jgi:hypothetical protein
MTEYRYGLDWGEGQKRLRKGDIGIEPDEEGHNFPGN